MLKLYHGWGSTCSKRVRIALAEKGLEWESQTIKSYPDRENLEPWYLALNPNGVVPTLDHDGEIIIESCVILEYLDDVFPEVPLRPENPVARARMRIWMDKAEHIIHRNINVISHNRRQLPSLAHVSQEERIAMAERYPRLEMREERVRRYREGVTQEEEDRAERALAEFMDDMNAQLEKTPWLAGESYSLADIAVIPYLERFEANGLGRLVDWSTRPAIGDWWARMTGRPAYAEGMQLDRATMQSTDAKK